MHTMNSKNTTLFTYYIVGRYAYSDAGDLNKMIMHTIALRCVLIYFITHEIELL